MAAHVLRCATCRSEYDEVAAAVGELLPGVPGVQPPLGFDERVLGRLGVRPPPHRDGAGRGWSPPLPPSSPSSPRVAWWAFSAGGDTPDLATLHADRWRRADGHGVAVSDVDGDPLMVVAIVDAPADVSYFCRTVLADGTTVDSESWPDGDGAWIVPLPSAPTWRPSRSSPPAPTTSGPPPRSMTASDRPIVRMPTRVQWNVAPDGHRSIAWTVVMWSASAADLSGR